MIRALWIAAAVGLLLSGLGAVLTPDRFPHAWLSAAVLFSGWPLGSLALLLIHPLTGGRWGDALTPALRLGVWLTPLLVPLWAPVVLVMPHLYPWAAGPVHNAWYLNAHDAALRGAAYLVVWVVLAALVLGNLHRRIAAPLLILLGLTVNFAAIDATLSLQPEFNSSSWGMIAAAGMTLLALALAVAITGPALHRHVRADAAKIMLGLLCLWQYLDFMQFLIVWQSDLVSEAPWLAARMYGFWGVVMALVFVDHFLLPFAVLLLPPLQRSNLALTGVAALVVLGEALRTWWTVLPAVPRPPGWLDLAAAAGVFCLGGAIVASIGGRHPVRSRVRHAEHSHA